MMSWLLRAAKAEVAVEFALITALFVLPLFLGAADFVTIIAAQQQLNTGLQALYYYGVTQGPSTPANAANTGASYAGNILTLINANSDFQLSFAATSPAYLSYLCYTTGGTPPSSDAGASTTLCSTSGTTTMTFANYSITTSAKLPIKLPGFANPLPLSASGYVQISTKNN